MLLENSTCVFWEQLNLHNNIHFQKNVIPGCAAWKVDFFKLPFVRKNIFIW